MRPKPLRPKPLRPRPCPLWPVSCLRMRARGTGSWRQGCRWLHALKCDMRPGARAAVALQKRLLLCRGVSLSLGASSRAGEAGAGGSAEEVRRSARQLQQPAGGAAQLTETRLVTRSGGALEKETDHKQGTTRKGAPNQREQTDHRRGCSAHRDAPRHPKRRCARERNRPQRTTSKGAL